MDSSSQRRQISHEGLEPHGRHISYDHTQDDYFSTLLNSTLRKQNYKARTVQQNVWPFCQSTVLQNCRNYLQYMAH